MISSLVMAVLAGAFGVIMVISHPNHKHLAKAERPAPLIPPVIQPMETSVMKKGISTAVADGGVMHPRPHCPTPDRGFNLLYTKAAHKYAPGSPHKFGCHVHSIAERESNQRPDAVSPVGAVGMLQFMPRTAADLGIDPRDPVQSIDGAARYLKWLTRRFPYVTPVDLKRFKLAAYNWGVGNVRRTGCTTWKCLKPLVPRETRKYVVGVLEMSRTGKWS